MAGQLAAASAITKMLPKNQHNNVDDKPIFAYKIRTSYLEQPKIAIY